MAPANKPFRLSALPAELQDQVWETTVGLDGPPLMQCLEADFLDGYQDPPGWFEGAHRPTIFIPTPRFGGAGTATASHFLHVQEVAKSSAEAREAIEHLQATLRLRNPGNILELKAKKRRRDISSPEDAAEVTVSLRTDRDVLCLQCPSQMYARALPFGLEQHDWYDLNSPPGYVNISWFSPQRIYDYDIWHIFRPLPFFGLDRMERVAIDFQCEMARHSLHRTCGRGACHMLRLAYHVHVYRTPRRYRRWCGKCLGGYLDGFNQGTPAQNGQRGMRLLLFQLDLLFFVAKPDRWGPVLPPDEPGTFTCESCRHEFPAGHDRLEEVSAGTWPFDVMEHTGWQPKCLPWHQPLMISDIDTLLMGRLPSLKAFYIIDNTVKLKHGRQPTLPYEEFAGSGCKFVEVNTDDDAWDISPRAYPPFHPATNPKPCNSFAFADRLQCVAWDHVARQHTQALMEEQRAADGDDDDLDDVPTAQLVAQMVMIPFADPVQDNQPLDMHIVRDDSEALMDVNFPAMDLSIYLRRHQGSWPESLLPVKVKVMARIDASPRDEQGETQDDGDIIFSSFGMLSRH